MKEAARGVPKEAVRRSIRRTAVQTEAQLRDAAENGQEQDDYDGEQFTDTILKTGQQAVYSGARLIRPKTGVKDTPTAEQPNDESGNSVQETTVKRAAHQAPIRGKDEYIRHQPERKASNPSKAVEEGRKLAVRQAERRAETVGQDSSAPTLQGKEREPVSRPSPKSRYEKQVPVPKGKSRVSPTRMMPVTTERSKAFLPMQVSQAQNTARKSVEIVGNTARSATVSAKQAALATAKAVQTAAKSTRTLVTVAGAGGCIVVVILIVVVLFGSLLSMVGGDHSSAVSPVSAEVEAYEPLIREYASQYGIGEYVELIKAIMMQESGGRGTDPMQAAESGYNTLYPREPGGITDPAYSIQCGVQVVRDVLELAGAENPLDMERIKLALQGYNYGPGYITWAVEHYGGYSLANAAEFSDMMAQRMGWERYGDKQYVAHVLRYYAFGRLPTGTGNPMLVEVALSQEGNGGAVYWSWYGFESRVEWCACFVSWCADRCGLIDSGAVGKFALCSDGAAWFAARGRLMDGSYVPSAGDIIFFDWGDDGTIDHVGIVERAAGGKVYTVEGNSSDLVRRKEYSLGSSSIYGYGV